ncbi:MAG: hypothetical protein ACREH9_02220, partial [Pseudomonadota bacterium]
MLNAAFIILGIAVLLGTALAAIFLRTESGAAAPWPLAALHGFCGAGGLACLLLALQGPARGFEHGTAAFGKISAALIALAALFGGAVLAIHLRTKHRAGTLIGVHAMLAVSGFVVLAAYI